MDFRELAYIVSIAKHQGVGKAAEELYVSQPTLSKFVQNLESSLGQPLFRRLGNKFLLTYAGKRYVETAQAMLAMKKEMDQELSDIIRESVGEFKIAVPIMRGIYILPRALPLFRERFPRVRVTVFEANSAELEHNILTGEIDLALVTVGDKHSDIVYEIINDEEIVLVMSPDHPLAGQGVIKPGCRYPWMDLHKLENEQFILQWTDQRTRQVSDKILHEAGIKPNIMLTVRNIFVSVQLAAAGYGMAFVGESPLRYIQTSVKPACFSVGKPKTTFSFAAAYRRGIYLPTYIRDFITIVKENN
jgi:DNA-binding transcriptional LysR family regulator